MQREPLHVRALTRVAELYCRRAEYKQALEYARKALDIAMYDADANYIYGIHRQADGQPGGRQGDTGMGGAVDEVSLQRLTANWAAFISWSATSNSRRSI